MNQPMPAVSARQAASREFFSIIFRRKWLILGLFLVTTATVVGIAFTTPVEYASSGSVLVRRGEFTSALSPNRQLFNNWEEDLGSEVAMAKASQVLARAREILADSATAYGEKIPLDGGRVDVEVSGKSNVLLIGYSDLDPVVAHRVCDALITAYLEFRQNRLSVGKPQGFFKAEITRVDSLVEVRMAEREAAAEAGGLVDLEQQPREWMSQAGSLEQRRNEAAAELAEAEAALRMMEKLRQNPDIDLPTLGNVFAFTNEAALVDLKRKIVDQETRIAQLSERFREDSPEVSNAKETLVTLRALLRREVEARLQMSASRIELLRARLGVVDRDLGTIQGQLAGVPAKQRRLNDLDQEIKSLRSRHDELTKAADIANVTENTSQGTSVVLLSPAGPAVARNTRDYVRLALAPAFSLVVGIGLAFFIDGLDLTVRTANQAEEYLEVPVLATLSERRRRRG